MKNYAKVGATGLSTDSTDYRIRISGLRFFFFITGENPFGARMRTYR